MSGGDSSPLPPPPLRLRLLSTREPSSRTRTFQDEYELGHRLDDGAYGTVHRCVHRASRGLFAVKIIDYPPPSFPNSLRVRNPLEEVLTLQALCDPGIIQVVDYVESKACLHIIMEEAPHRDLYHHVKERPLTEPQARWVLWQLLRTLRAVHSEGVIHRDVKLENCLVFGVERIPVALDGAVRYPLDDGDGAPGMAEDAPVTSVLHFLRIKLADFGCARFCEGDATTILGTGIYKAPEFATPGGGGYRSPVDIFAVGVLAYVLLCGRFPPSSNTSARNFFPPSIFSVDARSLISSLLSRNPEHRPTAAAALEAPFFAPLRAQRLREACDAWASALRLTRGSLTRYIPIPAHALPAVRHSGLAEARAISGALAVSGECAISAFSREPEGGAFVVSSTHAGALADAATRVEAWLVTHSGGSTSPALTTPVVVATSSAATSPSSGGGGTLASSQQQPPSLPSIISNTNCHVALRPAQQPQVTRHIIIDHSSTTHACKTLPDGSYNKGLRIVVTKFKALLERGSDDSERNMPSSTRGGERSAGNGGAASIPHSLSSIGLRCLGGDTRSLSASVRSHYSEYTSPISPSTNNGETAMTTTTSIEGDGDVCCASSSGGGGVGTSASTPPVHRELQQLQQQRGSCFLIEQALILIEQTQQQQQQLSSDGGDAAPMTTPHHHHVLVIATADGLPFLLAPRDEFPHMHARHCFSFAALVRIAAQTGWGVEVWHWGSYVPNDIVRACTEFPMTVKTVCLEPFRERVVVVRAAK